MKMSRRIVMFVLGLIIVSVFAIVVTTLANNVKIQAPKNLVLIKK